MPCSRSWALYTSAEIRDTLSNALKAIILKSESELLPSIQIYKSKKANYLLWWILKEYPITFLLRTLASWYRKMSSSMRYNGEGESRQPIVMRHYFVCLLWRLSAFLCLEWHLSMFRAVLAVPANSSSAWCVRSDARNKVLDAELHEIGACVWRFYGACSFVVFMDHALYGLLAWELRNSPQPLYVRVRQAACSKGFHKSSYSNVGILVGAWWWSRNTRMCITQVAWSLRIRWVCFVYAKQGKYAFWLSCEPRYVSTLNPASHV